MGTGLSVYERGGVAGEGKEAILEVSAEDWVIEHILDT